MMMEERGIDEDRGKGDSNVDFFFLSSSCFLIIGQSVFKSVKKWRGLGRGGGG